MMKNMTNTFYRFKGNLKTFQHKYVHCTFHHLLLSITSGPLKRKDVQNLFFKMEDIKDAIVETLEDVNVVIVETAEDVKDFAVDKMKDLKEAVIETEVGLVKSVETSVSLEVGEILELAGSKLEEMKETKMEEMVEEVKPRLRRETFENSLMLSRVGGRQFLLVLLVMAQVMAQIFTIRETVDDGAFDAKKC